MTEEGSDAILTIVSWLRKTVHFLPRMQAPSKDIARTTEGEIIRLHGVSRVA